MLQSTLSGLAVGSLFALIAVGFNLTFVVNRTVNFAHGQWVAAASLLAFTMLVTWQVPLFITIVSIGVLMGVLGIGLERVGIRPMIGHSLSLGFIMSTLAIGIMIESLGLWGWGTVALFVPSPLGEERMEFLGAGIYPQEIIVPAVTAVMLLGLAVLYRFTRVGRALRATSENPDAARLMGIDTKWMVGLAYGLAGLMAGVAGVLVAPLTGAFAAAGAGLGLKAFAIAIVGGLDSITGTLIAGLLLGVVEQYIALYISPGLRDVGVFAIVIAILIIRPFGLLGTSENEKV